MHIWDLRRQRCGDAAPAGRDIRQVVERIAQQRHRARHQRDGQFDQPGQRQSYGADGDRAVGLPAFTRIVGKSFERKTCRRVTDSVDQMRTA